MTSLHQVAHNSSDSIVGMAVSYKDEIIGKVIHILRDKYDELEGVQIRKNSDSTIMSIHSKRIEGIDETNSLLFVH